MEDSFLGKGTQQARRPAEFWSTGGCEHVDFDTAAYSIHMPAPTG